uniref:Uncharacterized protein n=1 Tax=Panagrolaimus davidi TaxID=227884 RepID=A0A914QVH5_9BILA
MFSVTPTTTPTTITTTTVSPGCAPTSCSINDLMDFTTTITGPTTDATTCITTIQIMCNGGLTMVRIRSGGTIVFVAPPVTLRCNEASGDFAYDFTPGTFSDVNSAFCQ